MAEQSNIERETPKINELVLSLEHLFQGYHMGITTMAIGIVFNRAFTRLNVSEERQESALKMIQKMAKTKEGESDGKQE